VFTVNFSKKETTTEVTKREDGGGQILFLIMTKKDNGQMSYEQKVKDNELFWFYVTQFINLTPLVTLC
jgi:hypothetical protein